MGGKAKANRLLMERGGTANTQIDAVSVSGQMMGVVPVNGAGEPVHPAIIWADTRSGAQCSSLIERVGMERAYAITGTV